MVIELAVSASSVAKLAAYLLQWLQSLAKASEERKLECLDAIEAVIVSVRQTQRYIRERDEGRVDPSKEAELAGIWTELGFRLSNLGIEKLAKRCDVKGRYWADPKKFSEEWWDQAGIGLDAVSDLARRLRAEVQAHGAPKG